MSAPLTALPEIHAFEVTLCRQGKNMKPRFPLWKAQEDEMADFNEILKSVLETELDEESQLDELFKGAGLTEKAMNAVKAANRILMGFKDEMPEDIMSKLAKLAGYAPPAKGEEDEMSDKMKKAIDELTKERDELAAKLEKAADGDNTDERFEEFKKAHDEAVVELRKSNEELAKALETERDARNLAGWRERVEKEASHYPGKSFDEMAKSLHRLEKADEALAKDLFEDMKKASNALKESSLLKAAGSAGAGSTSDAEAKLEKAAVELRKSNSDMTHEQAFAKALEENPDLYSDYLAGK